MIEIFPTSRALREFYSSFLDTNQLLPKAMSISELISNSTVVAEKSMADADTRVLLMQEASDFENFKDLKIDREFLSFIKNSTYLFRFFEELAIEDVQIDDLELADTYAEFAEHLSILKELLSRYKSILSEKKLYDKITLPSEYQLNEEFLKTNDGFTYHIEGFLNNFELNLFFKIAQFVPFKIYLHVTSYNQKMISLFKSLNISLHVDTIYLINLGTKSIEQEHAMPKNSFSYTVRGFSIKTLQCAFVYEKIADFVGKGIEPQNIAVIVPDEKFAITLKEFDSYKNLNFAMGESFTKNELYKKLDGIDKLLRLRDVEHKLRISRLGISQNVVENFQELWRKKLSPSEIIVCLNILCNDSNKDEIFEEELFKFERLLYSLGNIELQQAMKLFLNRLSALSRDDVMGGKVTVMGLLESRGMSYEGVIIVDFSDEFVPKRSQKDMFLSSQIREHAGLPSKSDRENLQRYFYYRLMQNANHVAISFTQNDQSMGSRFLDELGLHVEGNSDEQTYYKLLFDSHNQKQRFDPEIIEGSYDIKNTPLSASKLKTILTCKRQFYYKYILKSKEAKMPDAPINLADIGNILHEALHYVLKDKNVVDENTLMIDLRRYLQSEDRGLIWHYHLDIWLEYLKNFANLEAKRYEEGYRVEELEKSLHVTYNGFILEGKIDRIDVRDAHLTVIDYKSGKIPETTAKTLANAVDFQLEFYYLLAKELGEVEGLYYYDLKNGRMISESLFGEKLERLDAILEELKEPLVNFEKCESLAPCKFCPYTKLCDRNA